MVFHQGAHRETGLTHAPVGPPLSKSEASALFPPSIGGLGGQGTLTSFPPKLGGLGGQNQLNFVSPIKTQQSKITGFDQMRILWY
ncbi:hypothetical protein BI334_03525 [Moorena producens 3L]|nr:hypothetical protein BI334_03525 [Moorena producens 3L]